MVNIETSECGNPADKVREIQTIKEKFGTNPADKVHIVKYVKMEFNY